MSIIETFTKIIRGKTKTENVRTADYVIGDFPFATPDAISAESAMRISTVYSCIRACMKSAKTAAENRPIKILYTSCYTMLQTPGRLPQNFLK